MTAEIPPDHCYVVKADELLALNFLPASHAKPIRIEWINRATDRKLAPTTLEQFMRTYHRHDATPSVAQLRETTGVRAIFTSEKERSTFAANFAAARKAADEVLANNVTAIYGSHAEAEEGIARLLSEGVPPQAHSLLWRANMFIDGSPEKADGHSTRTVLASVTGGGLAGAALGVAILTIPGVGPVAAVGAVLASAYSAVATAGGIIGATGAAMATMLSDLDVDDYAANHLEQQLKSGRVFLSVDLRETGHPEGKIVELLEQTGGRII